MAYRSARNGHRISHFMSGLGVSIEGLVMVERRRGRHRTIRLFKHGELGHVFVLGNEIQHVEAWAPFYHEPLVHLAAAYVREVRDVLILGGGTLFAAAEALKYRSVERVVLVDHDPEVTATVGRYYSHARGCLRDPRFRLVTRDAYDSTISRAQSFDLVINDGLDLLDLHATRKGLDAFAHLTALARTRGVCSDLIQRHVFERSRVQRTVTRLRSRSNFALSLVAVPEYHGVLHMLSIWGSRDSNVSQSLRQPINVEQRRWVKDRRACPCTYYDPRFLHYYLYLPPQLRRLFKRSFS